MVDQLIKFTFETEATVGVTAPSVIVTDTVHEIAAGMSQWSVTIPDSGHLTMDFYSKTQQDTVLDSDGNIVRDTQFRINKIWADGIILETWFLNQAIYRPRYFADYLAQVPQAPAEIEACYQYNFPGVIQWQWESNFWDWYFDQKNSREVIHFMDKDPDRVWKFRGSLDPCEDLVSKIKKILAL